MEQGRQYADKHLKIPHSIVESKPVKKTIKKEKKIVKKEVQKVQKKVVKVAKKAALKKAN